MRKNLEKVFALSEFVAKTCSTSPEIAHHLTESGDLERTYSQDVYEERIKKAVSKAKDEKDLAVVLRRLRKQEMVRIAFRDLSGIADLHETVNDLSNLAASIIDSSFSFLHSTLEKKYGHPVSADGKRQKIVVIGMGKLGGRELNFSSDVDLIFSYPASGHTEGSAEKISNEEFFTRLCRDFLKLFTQTSDEGLLFRIDLRLRPFGENGPLVMSFNAMEEYYQVHGRGWERYALIKARAVAGDKAAGRELIKRLKPFVYRRYLDYSSFESLRDMKQSIELEVRRKGLQNNIKLGPGGIREIEFFGQIFQLIRGGVEPLLQEPSILKVLKILCQENYIEKQVKDELEKAYIFLRTTEHRLQEYADRQTHSVPVKPDNRKRLALSMGFNTWDMFFNELEKHMKNVHSHFRRILERENSSGENELPDKSASEKELQGVWLNIFENEESEKALSEVGFKSAEEMIRLLDALRNNSETRALSSEGRRLIDKLIPHVIQEAGQSEHPDLALKRIASLIIAIERRTTYISLLLENPAVLRHLIKLSLISPWIISFLSRHPVLLDELLDARTLYRPPSRADLALDIQNRLKKIPDEDLEYQIEELCIFKNVNVLRVSAADITDAYPLMRVSDHLSDIAEIIIEKVLDLSWAYLVNKYGAPALFKENDKGFGVVAYGKLGGLELGYGSDLDLVFLHTADPGKTKGKKSIDHGQLFARLAQRIIHILTTRTRTGTLYETDMRLRPNGNSGVLVMNIESFRDYQIENAWTWEHQALVRARMICGDTLISRRFDDIRKEILTCKRDKSALLNEIMNMRERMRKEHEKRTPGIFDVKQGRGGIVDIEFLVQYLVLLHAHDNEELVKWSDNVRQLETLAAAGVLSEETALFLKEAYLAFRSTVHRLNLKDKSAKVPEEEFQGMRQKVKDIWNAFFVS